MPCNDGPTAWELELRNKRLLVEREAMLCAVFSVLEKEGRLNDTLRSIDAKQAGVKPQKILAWWKQHKAADEEKRRGERRKTLRAHKRAKAIAKLTPAERKLLGLKDE